MSTNPDLARLVSLACHDIRTPLATVQGFAKTLVRLEALDAQTARYLGMIDEASAEIVELLDALSLLARIAGGRYDPVLRDADSLELAQAAAERAGVGTTVAGSGAVVRVDPGAAERSLAAFAVAARRHGGLGSVALDVDGAAVRVGPVVESAAAVVLGEDLKDLGAAIAVHAVAAGGGSVELEGETLVVRLPSG